MVFSRIGGRRCWPKLFTPPDHQPAFLPMKRPHKRLFHFPRRSMNSMTLPSCLLTPGTVLLRQHMRNKGNPFCDPVNLWRGIPLILLCAYWMVEKAVSTSDLAPYPPVHNSNADPVNTDSLPESDGLCSNNVEDVAADKTDGVRCEKENDKSSISEDIASESEPALPCRSTRRRKPLIGMVSMPRQFERERLWRFVCCCLAAFMSLSRNVNCCHNHLGHLAFVFYRCVEWTAMLLAAITHTDAALCFWRW